MAKNSKFKGQLAKAFEDAGISEKIIDRGDIWYISDDLIIFPEDRLPKTKRQKHLNRPVLILSCSDDLKNLKFLSALISPLSTVVQAKAATDFFVNAGVGGLKEDSMIRLGLIQPILKVDLKEKIGNIGNDILDQVNTVVLCNLGILQRSK